MAAVEVAPGGAVKIPANIRKKYRIRNGMKLVISDEQGVITIRPQVDDAIRLAKAKDRLKTGT